MADNRPDRLRAALQGPITDPTIPALRDPDAWLAAVTAALQKLPVDGDLGAHLEAIASGPIAEGLAASPGRAVLLGEVVLNLAKTGRINQGMKGTCAATCIEAWLAETLPDEYARLCAGLIAPAGSVVLRSGEPLIRDEDRLVWADAEEKRSPVSRLFQAACMELAYPELDYCNIGDVQRDEDGESVGYGLKLEAFDHLLEVITGQQWDMVSDLYARLLAMLGMDGEDVPDLKRDGAGIIQRSLAAGQHLFATLSLKDAQWEGEAVEIADHITHKVRLVGISGDQVILEDPLNPEEPWFNAADTALINTEGRASLSMDDLIEMTVELSYQPRFWPG